MILGVEATAGVPAILTAIGGVCVSVFTVYKNAKRQDRATQENTDHIKALTDQIKTLTDQVIDLKAVNASLQTELTILKTAQVKTQAQVDYALPEPPKPKKARKKKEK